MQNSETETDNAPVSDDTQSINQPESEEQSPAAPEAEASEEQLEPIAEDLDAPADDEGETSDEEAEEGEGEEEEAEDDESALPLMSVVEAVLFAAREPLKLVQIARAVGKRTRQEAVRTAIDELNLVYLDSGRAFEIADISGRYQLMSKPEYARHIMRLYPKRELTDKDKAHKLTPAALEHLTIVAYKQPVTRGEIEHIRGVGCGQTIRTLMERGSVIKKGKREDLIGQPPTYVTTDSFLVEFGLGSLDELPMRHEIVGMFGPSFPVAEPEVVPADDAEPDEAPEPEEEAQPQPEPEPEPESDTDEDPIPHESDTSSRKEDAFPNDFS